MKARALLELTVDLANPASELAAAISAVLGSIAPAQRESVLRSLDEEIGVALAGFETYETEVTT
ncbi:hypothetical protein [Paenibacillus sp. FSL H8-0259]|uniref:hypothetical protein n=1 Tax=Paenibacillus sp. FSL H8-0259 TaxID=1920423 RepID=UPI00096D39CB|nr:hypothetical protein [Paenibacillus sp. FSL H8-0259]OMF21897.1 hypothetical protein BK132_31710 [Paenibacillus sp. FSL H8-0259]